MLYFFVVKFTEVESCCVSVVYLISSKANLIVMYDTLDSIVKRRQNVFEGYPKFIILSSRGTVEKINMGKVTTLVIFLEWYSMKY